MTETGRVVIVRGGAQGFAQDITIGPHHLTADEPATSGGPDRSDPSSIPFDRSWLRHGRWDDGRTTKFPRSIIGHESARPPDFI